MKTLCQFFLPTLYTVCTVCFLQTASHGPLDLEDRVGSSCSLTRAINDRIVRCALVPISCYFRDCKATHER